MKWFILASCLVAVCTACSSDGECLLSRCRKDHDASFHTEASTCVAGKCACPDGYHHTFIDIDLGAIGKRDTSDCDGACAGEHCHCGHGACHGECTRAALLYRSVDHSTQKRDTSDCDGACAGEHCHCGHGACHGECTRAELLYRSVDKKRDTSDCDGACAGEHCHCGHGACHGECTKAALLYRSVDHSNLKRDTSDCDGACAGEHCHCGHGACHGECTRASLLYRRTECDPPCADGYTCKHGHGGTATCEANN